MQAIIPILLLALAISTALNVLLRRSSIPTVVGYIITGTVLAAMLKVDAGSSETLDHIAEFGIVFLMFTIGLEFSFPQLKKMQREVFVFGFLQVSLTTIAISALAYALFGIPPVNAAIIGSALSLSSTAIVLKILNESGKIKSAEGRNSVGILIFQDIAVIPILLAISLVTATGQSASSLIGQTVINAFIVITAIYLFGRFVLRWFFRIISNTNSKEIYIGFVLLTTIGASYFSHHFGFSYSLGGFLAGMMIADTIYKHQVEADLIPFRDLLLGVFFISVGLQIDLDIVGANFVTIGLLCLSLMAIKAIILYLILATACAPVISVRSAISLAQIGEFSLVVLSLMLGHRMMADEKVQILMVTVVISMIATPFLINNMDRVIRILFRNSKDADPSDSLSLISGHVVLLGFGHLGQLISRFLDQAGIQHVVVTDGTDEYVKARDLGKMAVFGDPGDRVLLRNVGINQAMSTIIALEDIEAVKRTSAAITLIDPTISVIARVSTEEEKSEVESFEHEMVLDGNTSTATLIVDQIQRSRLLAKEASEIRYMKDVDKAAPDEAIHMIEAEQKRLLDLASTSFNSMRKREDVMRLKAYHESFKALSEIIEAAIRRVIDRANLSLAQYETINTLLDNHNSLISLNAVLEQLGRELLVLSAEDATRPLADLAVEGLDAILLTLIELAREYNAMEMAALNAMTSSEGKGFAVIREKYLGTERGVSAAGKALLLSATNHMDRLRALFGEVGNNYRKLAGRASQPQGSVSAIGIRDS